MAHIVVSSRELVVRLGLLEKVMALRGNVHIPLAAVESVEVQRKPLRKQPAIDVAMGFAARGAPGSGLATVGPRATFGGGRALLVVWGNGRSVVVRLAPNTSGYRLLIVSSGDADQIAETLRSACR